MPRDRRSPCSVASLRAKWIAWRATSPSDRRLRFAIFFNRMAVAITRGKIHLAVDATGILVQVLLDHAHAFQQTRANPWPPRNRRLPMLLLMETWSTACCWVSDCTSCSIVSPDSDSRCSIQVSGKAQGRALSLQSARELRDK